MTTTKPSVAARRIAADCLAGRARLISRAVSGIYGDALRPYGITVAQMSILVAAATRPEARPGDLGSILCLEKSTLSRNVDRMIDRGWLEAASGEDGRSQRLRATARGKRLVEKVAPAWRTAQRKARTLLGEDGAAALHRLGNRLMAGSHD